MATSPKGNVEMVRRGLSAWTGGDLEATMKTLAEDVEVFVPSELANAGTYHGHDGFLQWLSAWNEAWAEMTYEVEGLTPVGERHVVALVRNRGRGRGSGVEVMQTRGWVFEVRGEVCSFFSLQRDRDTAVAVAREREIPGA
jgi:ketosteroid isomerase-like protein